jgi:hypothetical protein
VGHACQFIEKNKDQPWMLYLNYLEPHIPFNGPLNDLHSEQEASAPSNYPGAPIEREPELYRRSRQNYLENGFDGHDLSIQPAVAQPHLRGPVQPGGSEQRANPQEARRFRPGR